MKGRALLVCLKLLLVLPVSASGAEGSAETRTLRVAIRSDIRSLNPGVRRDGVTDIVHHHVFEGLVTYNDALNVVPMLAERIDVSSDGRAYRFKLRQGVKFHNGEALTADVVAWNWERMLTPGTRWRCISWFDGSASYSAHITGIEVTGTYELTFFLAAPSASFLHRMANVQCFSAIVHPSSVAGGEVVAPVGTGPYRLHEWRRGEYVELKRFEDYAARKEPPDGLSGRKLASSATIRFLIVPDASAARSALLAGSVDLIQAPITLYPEFRELPQVTTHVQPMMNWVVLLVQTEDPLLSDIRIRQAIAHAIDREQLAKFATAGFGRANSSAVPDRSPYYTDAHRRWYAFDPVESTRLLREAGYRGEPVTIQTNKKYSHLYDNAIVIHSMLRDAGFNSRLAVLDWATQLDNFYSGRFQLSSFDFSARTEPYLNYLIMTGPKEEDANNQWDSDGALSLLQRTETVSSFHARAAMFDKLHAMMMDEIPIIGLYNSQELILSSPGVRGFEPWSVGLLRMWGVSVDSGRR